MAVPTFIRALPAGSPVGTPAEGPTAGRALVEIYGSGFRTVPAPSSSGPTGPTYGGVVIASEQRTVRVRFGGVDAERVDVVRSNLIRVITPVCPLEVPKPGELPGGAVDIEITNLDDSGSPIVGETLTVTGAYTYRMVKLDSATPADLTRAIRALLVSAANQVLNNVILTQHTDYDPDTSTAFVENATTPALVFSGPAMPENRFYSLNEDPEERIGDVVEIRRKPRTVDLVFRVIGITDSITELLNLMALATEWMNRNPYFYVLRDDADPSKGSARYEFVQLQEFETTSRPSASNVHYFSGQIAIRGFDIESLAGMPSDHLKGLSRDLASDPSITTGGGPA